MKYRGKDAQVVTVRDATTDKVYSKLEDIADGREVLDVRIHQVDDSTWEATAIVEKRLLRQQLVEG